MASAIAALNAKIRSHPVLSYICSTRELAQLYLQLAIVPLPNGMRYIPHDYTMPFLPFLFLWF